MDIKNFTYDGMFVNELPGNAPYTVEFVEWTGDPGIFLGKCSDGKERFIPSCMPVNEQDLPPEPDYSALREKMKKENILIHMGAASSSI